MAGPDSHAWWAMVVLLLVSASIFGSMLFSYLFLWTVSPHIWPDGDALPSFVWPIAAAVLLLASSACISGASRSLKRGEAHMRIAILLPVAVLLLAASLAVDLQGQWQTGLRPAATAYGAAVYTLIGLQGFFVLVVSTMGLYTFARNRCGLLDGRRRVTFDNTVQLWHYTVAQGLTGLALIHSFPRLVGTGPIVRAVHFLLIYSLTGIVCARPDWQQDLPLGWAIGAASIVATGIIVSTHLRMRPIRGSANDADFVGRISASLALLSIVAIVWETLPALLVPACA